LLNHGRITGHGNLGTNLNNATDGTVRLDAGQVLTLKGGGIDHPAAATRDLRGGELNVVGGLVNQAGGRIYLNGGRLGTRDGLLNQGQVLVSFGGGVLDTAITVATQGKVIVSGNSNAEFRGVVDVQSGGELRVSSGSAAVFFDQVLQRTGSVFSGTGAKFYEGGLSIGASPGLGTDEGDVSFGSGSTYLAEIGGASACTLACATDEAFKNSSYDKYIVKGHLGLGGVLKLASWNSFVAQAGMSFDLLDWGTERGVFDRIDASELRLAAGTALDYSRLYSDGTITVQTVPEPDSLLSLLSGLGVLGVMGLRRRGR